MFRSWGDRIHTKVNLGSWRGRAARAFVGGMDKSRGLMFSRVSCFLLDLILSNLLSLLSFFSEEGRKGTERTQPSALSLQDNELRETNPDEQLISEEVGEGKGTCFEGHRKANERVPHRKKLSTRHP